MESVAQTEEPKVPSNEDVRQQSPSRGSHHSNTPNLARQQSLKAFAPKETPMKAVFLTEVGKPLIVSEMIPPKPGKDEVLIKVEAAPIHPSDFAFVRGYHGHLQPPFQVGLEGAGTVLSSGGGAGNSLVGQRVSFGASPSKPGSWAQFIVTNAKNCFPLDKDVCFENGACGIINPFTAVAFAETIKNEKHKAIVQSSAASQLGRMILNLLKKEGVKVISIVRKAEHEKIVEGSDVILNYESEDFEEKLKATVNELKATCMLECVCGETTHKIMRAMPPNSLCYIFGHLAKDELTDIDLTDLLVNNKTIKAFTFSNWFESQGFFSKFRIVRKVQKLISGDLKTEVAKTFKMEEINEALAYYKHHMAEGKVIIKPNPEEVKEEEIKEEEQPKAENAENAEVKKDQE